jgi:hypothetical protein
MTRKFQLFQESGVRMVVTFLLLVFGIPSLMIAQEIGPSSGTIQQLDRDAQARQRGTQRTQQFERHEGGRFPGAREERRAVGISKRATRQFNVIQL